MCKFLFMFTVLAMFFSVQGAFAATRQEQQEAELDKQIGLLKTKEDEYSDAAAKVEAISQYLSERPDTLLMFAEEIADNTRWFGVGRATGFEGRVMRAVMLTYGLPLPFDLEESLWGKKEHVRDVTLFALARHKNLIKAGKSADDLKAMLKNVRETGLSCVQVAEAKKYIETTGYVSFSNIQSIGDLPVRPADTPTGYVSQQENWKSKILPNAGTMESKKHVRETEDYTIKGKVKRFFEHVGLSLAIPFVYPAARIYFIYDSNKSFRLLQIMCERIMANVELKQAGLKKDDSLEVIQKNSATTPLEALLNYSGLSRTRLKNIDGVMDRVAIRSVSDLFSYLSLKTSPNQALNLIKNALLASAKPADTLNDNTKKRAKQQFYSIASSCAAERSLFSNAPLALPFKEPLLGLVLNTVAESLGKSKDLSLEKEALIAFIRSNLNGQMPGLTSDDVGVIPYYMDDPYSALEQLPYKTYVPFFVDLKRLGEDRREGKPIYDAVNAPPVIIQQATQ